MLFNVVTGITANYPIMLTYGIVFALAITVPLKDTISESEVTHCGLCHIYIIKNPWAKRRWMVRIPQTSVCKMSNYSNFDDH